MIALLTSWLFGGPRTRLKYTCDKHGTIATVLRFERDKEAKRYCAACFRETLREVRTADE